MKTINLFISSLLLGFNSICLDAQDTIYARQVISKLSSKEFHGRGYVKKGNRKAGAFIAAEFKKFHLESFKSGVFQEFPINVNTFPTTVELFVNNKELVPGRDFLLDPASISSSGSFPVHKIYSSDLKELNTLVKSLMQFPHYILWIDDRKDSGYLKQERKLKPLLLNALATLPPNACPAVIISSPGKLSWTIYSYMQPIPIFTVRSVVQPDSLIKVSYAVRNKFLTDYKTRNVVAYVKGKTKPDSLIVITAHYDHLGMMGQNAYFPGANDNASGTSMLLSLARYYSRPENRPEYTIVFLALSAEELGLLGSTYFTEHPLFDLRSIKFLLNIDMAGNGDQGITVVNGTIFRDKFDLLQKINSESGFLKQVKIRGEACNSDHCPFYMKGVPCFFIYTMGGVPYYHDIYDRSETLPLGSFTNYFKLLSEFIDRL